MSNVCLSEAWYQAGPCTLNQEQTDSGKKKQRELGLNQSQRTKKAPRQRQFYLLLVQAPGYSCQVKYSRTQDLRCSN